MLKNHEPSKDGQAETLSAWEWTIFEARWVPLFPRFGFCPAHADALGLIDIGDVNMHLCRHSGPTLDALVRASG